MTVLMYKGKGIENQCNNYRGMGLLSIRVQVCSRVMTERIKRIPSVAVSPKQRGLLKGHDGVNKFFAQRINYENF